MNCPRLTTHRLELRRTILDDSAVLFAIHGDPEVARFLPRDPCPDVAACRSLVAEMQRVEERGQGFRWSLWFEGAVVGSAGFHAWSRSQGRAQISYELIPEARGRGLASEAVTALVEYGFESMDLVRVTAEVHEANLPSQRLLLRLGFRRCGGYLRLLEKGGDAWYRRFERLR